MPPKSWEPTTEQRRFIRQYTEALCSGAAAVFAGAGLSRSAGYVDWKALLKDIASDLGLDVDRETDLIAIAQYHLNEKRNRSGINKAIIEELARAATPTRSHALVARLPLPTAWTTNYDQLLERSFEEAGKIVDLKITKENLAQTKRGRDVVLYKMHGCVTQPHEAVVTKDDYEQYEQKRSLFIEKLEGDLITSTFLFLGFSFTDPNIDYILSRIRVLLGANLRAHFCIMRAPQRPSPFSGRKKAEYEYERRKTALRQEDLLRFGIETVWIDDYAHVTPLLEALSAFIHRKAVFISGAAEDPSPLGQPRLNDLVREVGMRLIRDGYNLVSGFGFGLGEQCVVGALHALYGIPKGADLERLVVRPFPRAMAASQQVLDTKHREELLSRSGIVVVISGNRAVAGGTTEISPGTLEEVEIALREGKIVIPVGATGHAARMVWERARAEPQKFLPGIKTADELTVLGNSSATNEQLLVALFHLLAKAEAAVTV